MMSRGRGIDASQQSEAGLNTCTCTCTLGRCCQHSMQALTVLAAQLMYTPPPSLPSSVPQVESLKASRVDAKGNAYLEYVLDKHLAFLADPTNIAFEELELPQIIQVRQQQGRERGEKSGPQGRRVCCEAGGGC